MSLPIFTRLIRNINRNKLNVIIYRSITNKNDPSKWDLFAAICLQRCPVIVPELNWLEKRVQNLLNKIEIANSLYSDHEMRHFEDLRRAERIASGVNVDEKDLEEAAKQTAQDFEEASIEELKQFKFGNSVTNADLSNNVKSIDRSLDKYLYLIVKTKLGPKEHWLFPQEQYQSELDQSSLRKTAERALEKCFPDDEKNKSKINVKFLGNCPAAYYHYRYPQDLIEQRKKLGARIFLFKCQLDVNDEKQYSSLQGQTFGDRTLKIENYSDFCWSTRNELYEKMPSKYWKEFVQRTIYPDQLINIDKIMQKTQIAKHNRLKRLTQKLDKIQLSN